MNLIKLDASDNTMTILGSVIEVNLQQTPTNNVTLQQVGRRGPKGDGDKHFEQTFSPTDFLSVIHDLGKLPAVTIIDSAGTEVVGDVYHINNNQLTVSFTAAFGGKVICN